MPDLSIADAVNRYIDMVRLSRRPRTTSTYRNALLAFSRSLTSHSVDPNTVSVAKISEDAVAWLAADLKTLAPATESLYLTATAGFFEFLAAEKLADVNLPRVRLLIRQRSRRPGIRLPQFPQDDIDRILAQLDTLAHTPVEDSREHLRNLRDRAFLYTLADTGLRVHEACGLRRGDMDWNTRRAIVIGKGNRQAVVRFSTRAVRACRDYLGERKDGSKGRSLASQPIFARHDRAAGDALEPVSTNTGRNIVTDRVRQFLGEEAVGTITPHSFRHYFVTRILQSSGNLKLAQELARHRNIAVTQRYAHLSDDELDSAYREAIEVEPD